MLNFPSAPTTGQVFESYIFDGQKWTNRLPPKTVAPPSNSNPLMNGGVMAGVVTSYARGGHVHPSDSSRAKPNNETLTGTTALASASISGNANLTGIFQSFANGHVLGWHSGSVPPPLKSDANIKLYDVGGNNWAGIGCDGGGNVWIRTGLSGTPGPALFIDQARQATFLNPPLAPTPAAGDNSNKLATTAFVLANPASGPFLPLAGGTVTGLMYINGDLRTWRGGGDEGVIFLNNTGDRYLHCVGGHYYFNGAHAYSAAGRLWGTNDFSVPIVNIRMAFLADYTHAYQSGLAEPYAGGCQTGASGYNSPSAGASQARYRQFQMQLGGTWYAVDYV